jgi:hypothetical protein
VQRDRPSEPLSLPIPPPLDAAFAERVRRQAHAALAGEPRRARLLSQALVASPVILYLAWAAQFLASLWQ